MIDERKKQGVKIGDRKESKTVNELDNIKELKNYNFKSKRNIKALKNKVTQERDDDEVDDNEEPEYSSDQFGGKHSKKTYK